MNDERVTVSQTLRRHIESVGAPKAAERAKVSLPVVREFLASKGDLTTGELDGLCWILGLNLEWSPEDDVFEDHTV